MKITAVRAYEVAFGMALGPYKSAKGSLDKLTTTIVAIDTDDGVTGWGEVCPWGANYLPALHGAVLPILRELAPSVIGRDPRMLAEINDAMDRAVMGQLYVKTALDYACWDILGKATGLPVYALLGGKLTERLPLIASIPGGVEDMRRTVAHYLSKGHRQYSLHISAPNRQDFPAYREVIESFAPETWVSIDANQSWTMMTAVEVARTFADLTIALEQPVADLEQCAILRRKIDLPMILDETIVTPGDTMRAGVTGTFEGIGLKIGRCGGLTKARRVCDAADSLGLVYWMKDVIGTEIATLATAHLAHSRPPKNLAGALSCIELADTVTGAAALAHENGDMFVPDMTPGLGFEPDMGVLGELVARFD